MMIDRKFKKKNTTKTRIILIRDRDETDSTLAGYLAKSMLKY